MRGPKLIEWSPPSEVKLVETALDRRLGTTACHATYDDGYCCWIGCPQIRDGEPKKTGRHCPLDVHDEDDEGRAGG